jgi:hypothetical protein
VPGLAGWEQEVQQLEGDLEVEDTFALDETERNMLNDAIAPPAAPVAPDAAADEVNDELGDAGISADEVTPARFL